MAREHRVIFAIAAAAAPAYNAWWRANIDPAGDTFTVGLNATRNPKDPVVAYWACMTLTTAELFKIAKKLAQLSGLPLPTNGTTTAQKKAWLIDNKAAILSAGKCRFKLIMNDGAAVDPLDLLAAAGLKPIGSNGNGQPKQPTETKPVGA